MMLLLFLEFKLYYYCINIVTLFTVLKLIVAQLQVLSSSKICSNSAQW